MSRDKLPSPFSNRCIRQTSFAETYSRLFFGVVFSEAADKKQTRCGLSRPTSSAA